MINKKSKVIFICILVFIALFWLGVILFIINIKNIFDYGISKELVVNEIYEKGFDKININSGAGVINIKNSTDGKIKLLVYGNEDKITVKDDKNLDINIKGKKCYIFCFRVKVAKVELYLPNDYDKEIHIKNKFGDIKVGSFENGEFDIRSEFGDTKIEEVNKLFVDGNFGDIRINKINGSFNISNDFGDIRIKSIDIKDTSKINGNFGDIRIGSTNEIYISAKTDFGDVKINKNYRKSDIVLKINNDFGDIRVKN